MNSIVHKITNNLKNENVDNTAINDIIQQVKEYWQYFGTIDWDEIDYIGILKAINCAKFLKAKFNDESKYLIMRKALVYQNDGVCVFKPTSFEESSIIGEPICCFAYSQGRWDEHYIGNGEAIYYVFDAMRDNAQDFVAITVHPNGKALILDKNHNWWTPSDSIKYIQSLGNGASLITTKAGKQINNEEIKENRKMNKKQVIRINENKLRKIVTESVKKVLNESVDNNLEQYLYRLTESAKMLKKLSGKSSTDEPQDTLYSRVWNFVNALEDLLFEYGLSDYQNMGVNESNNDKSVDWTKHDERNNGNSFHGDKLAYKQHVSNLFKKRGESPERQQDLMKSTMKHLRDGCRF